MGQKRSYKQYPKEFKEEAVALVKEQGYSVPKAAESLGIATNMLYRWKEQIEQKQAGITLAEDERSELKRLRREVKTLRVEKEILKKASVDSSGHCNSLTKLLICMSTYYETSKTNFHPRRERPSL
jgi:transposase